MAKKIESPDIVQRYVDKFKHATAGQMERYSSEALQWFKNRVTKDMNLSRSLLISDHGGYKERAAREDKGLIGKMYYFKYAAEEAGDKDVGVYDEYPCIFVFNSITNDHGNELIYGVNLHYLPPTDRIKFLEQLLRLEHNTNYTAKTRLTMTWKLIKGVASSKYYEKTVHAYRADRFLSPMIEIHPRDWDVVACLQLMKWKQVGMDRNTLSQSHLRKMVNKMKRGA